jgi:hypothetical protein
MKLLPFAVLRYASVLMLLMWAIGSHAQAPIFSISDESVEPGTTLLVAVEVENFDMIVGAQFSIEWDSTQLEYTGLSNFAFGATAEDNFNTLRTENGKLGYQYADPTVQGMNLPDGTALFQVHFNVLGADGEQTEIRFGDSPVPREISDTSITAIAVTYESGTINIGETSDAVDRDPEGFGVTVAPNPFTASAQIRWTAAGNGPVRIVVLNTAGQLIRQYDHPRGAAPIFTLRAEDLPASGTYLIELHTQNGKTTRKVAFVKP